MKQTITKTEEDFDLSGEISEVVAKLEAAKKKYEGYSVNIIHDGFYDTQYYSLEAERLETDEELEARLTREGLAKKKKKEELEKKIKELQKELTSL